MEGSHTSTIAGTSNSSSHFSCSLSQQQQLKITPSSNLVVPERQPAHRHQAVSDNEGSDEGSEEEDSGADDSMSSNSSSTTRSCDSQDNPDNDADDRGGNGGGGGCMIDGTSSRAAATRTQPQIAVKKKRVRWEKIQFRDFALVVGDHPLCADGLPVSLAWQYNDHATPAINLLVPQQTSPVQGQNSDGEDRNDNSTAAIATTAVEACRSSAYVFPRRLTYQDRLMRLQTVSDLTLDEIKNDEIELVVRTLNENFFGSDDQERQLQQNESDRRITKDPIPVPSSDNDNCSFDFDGDVIMFDGDDDSGGDNNGGNAIFSKNDEAIGRFLLFAKEKDIIDDVDDDDDDRFDMSSFDWGVGSGTR